MDILIVNINIIQLINGGCSLKMFSADSYPFLFDYENCYPSTFEQFILEKLTYVTVNLNWYIEGILPIRPSPPCLHMADRALLAGYPWYVYVCKVPEFITQCTSLYRITRLLFHHRINAVDSVACSHNQQTLIQQMESCCSVWSGWCKFYAPVICRDHKYICQNV